MNSSKLYMEASIKTADDLKTIAQVLFDQHLTQLSLPEVEAVADQIARMVPAGNVPGLILSGLARLPTRKIEKKDARQEIDMLFQGVQQGLDKAVYGAFFAGPAAIIWGYQNLLKLAGKDPADSFPEGPWQFYVDYAMREDTARHANETHGFDTDLAQHGIQLSRADRITAWVMAALQCLHQYDALLKNEWCERVHIHLLAGVTKNEPNAARYAQLYRIWEEERPYGIPSRSATNKSYPAYRQQKFIEFLERMTYDLPSRLKKEWRDLRGRAEAEEMEPYLKQMSILAYLSPGPYGETRTPIDIADACVGLVYNGRYYLIPACDPNQAQNVSLVRSMVHSMFNFSPAKPVAVPPLATIKRTEWPRLQEELNSTLVQQLQELHRAPILLNCDRRPHQLELSSIRQAERGIGSHALTLFDTGKTVVFDQSHIFFDGAWGAALAEIMTREASSWVRKLDDLGTPPRPHSLSLQALKFNFQFSDREIIQKAPQVAAEAAAETEAVDIKAMQTLRRHFEERSDQVKLTINDLLVLYRAIHALTYQPNPVLVETLRQLSAHDLAQPAANAALDAIDPDNRTNPAMVLPVDASRRSPRNRLYPITFEVPIYDLDLISLHRQTITALNACDQAVADPTESYPEFDQLQKHYLATLAGFGELLSKTKKIAMAGDSLSVRSIDLLAHMPLPMQRLLGKVPEQFDMLNDLIKGREVLSNVGAVVPDSTLTRFISAKDDNDKKTLIWGFITDSRGVMRVSLRDFRPHVAVLAAVNQKELANHLTRDYLEAYARGLNEFTADLQRITLASRAKFRQK